MAQDRHPPEKPSECGNLAAQILRQKLAGFLSEIEEDSARFEDGDRRAAAAGSLAGDRWYAIIGLDRQKFRPKLITPPEIDWVNSVRQPCLFEEQRDLLAPPSIKIDHRSRFAASRPVFQRRPRRKMEGEFKAGSEATFQSRRRAALS